MGVGGIVSRNDTGLPAQRRRWLHSVGWSNSVGISFPGGVRGPAWRGFAFDPGARDEPEHSMPWWGGGQVRCRGSRAASSGAEPHARGWVPRARRELARGDVKPSSEAEVSWFEACPSSETKVHPRGAEAGYLMGR
jgi:hypothetical protein